MTLEEITFTKEETELLILADVADPTGAATDAAKAVKEMYRVAGRLKDRTIASRLYKLCGKISNKIGGPSPFGNTRKNKN